MENNGRTPQDFLKEPYERVVIPEEGGGFTALITEFEGCIAFGDTADEALKNLEEVATEWLESELERNHDIPVAWRTQEFSGKLLLRLPKSLHGELARLAEKEGTSLNQYILAKLAGQAGEDRITATIVRQIGQFSSFASQICVVNMESVNRGMEGWAHFSNWGTDLGSEKKPGMLRKVHRSALERG